MLVAGPRDFTDRIQYQLDSENYPGLRIVGVATEPSTTVEALESNKSDITVTLLGFPDSILEHTIDLIKRQSTKSVIFVSVDDLGVSYQKWLAKRVKVAETRKELKTIYKHFASKPTISRQDDLSEKGRDIRDGRQEIAKKARIEETIRREDTHRAVGIRQKVMVITGQKGGVGKTAITVSMAQTLAVASSLKVVVLDLDMNRDFGDVIRYFGYLKDDKDDIVQVRRDSREKRNAMFKTTPGEKTIAAWKDFPFEMRTDPNVVMEYLIKVRPNLYVLPPMRRFFTETASIKYDLVVKVIDVMKRHFDVILVDGGNTLTEATLAAIEMSDELIIVTRPGLTVLDNLADFTTYTLNSIEGNPIVSIVVNIIGPKYPHELNKDILKMTGKYAPAALIPRDDDLDNMIELEAQVPYYGAHDIPFTQGIEKLLIKIFGKDIFGKKEGPQKQNVFNGIFKKLGFGGRA